MFENTSTRDVILNSPLKVFTLMTQSPFYFQIVLGGLTEGVSNVEGRESCRYRFLEIRRWQSGSTPRGQGRGTLKTE